ncbi:HAAS signaling domain-containing protein [Streptomyces sp. NPDC090022]|uniref:HAAS signaling domain-containing protein n=1 Tax=Streptomyces sp. NPDC090022 TaxID=3365920 RepID=UPI003803F1C1
MGIESDHLVYAYLSEVGDLAQRSQLPSGERMRLVAGLRDEIDRRRARFEPETVSSVRQILDRLGTPEQVLAEHTALAARGPVAEPGGGGVPAQRGPERPRPATVGLPPHMAGEKELGPEPDWWRMSKAPGPYGVGQIEVEGFAGGIEYPRAPERELEADEPGPEEEREPEAPQKRSIVRVLLERRRARKADAAAGAGAGAGGSGAGAAARPKPHGFLLLAAAVLAVGVVTGYWMLLAFGWAIAYASRVLGPTEKKWVVFGLPGAVFAAAVVWVWGRLNGRWGEPLVDTDLGSAFQGLWPWIVRGAAVASALYLVWRARRRP